MTIPPVKEREQRACDDNDECMFLQGEECLCTISDYAYMQQRQFDRFIHFCRYHMTIYEYRELIDSGI